MVIITGDDNPYGTDLDWVSAKDAKDVWHIDGDVFDYVGAGQTIKDFGEVL